MNPLRNKLADELAFFVERSRDCDTAADRVLDVLAEHIGDGLLDKHGQRKQLAQVATRHVVPSDGAWTTLVTSRSHLIWNNESHVCDDRCAPMFVLERSGDAS